MLHYNYKFGAYFFRILVNKCGEKEVKCLKANICRNKRSIIIWAWFVITFLLDQCQSNSLPKATKYDIIMIILAFFWSLLKITNIYNIYYFTIHSTTLRSWYHIQVRIFFPKIDSMLTDTNWDNKHFYTLCVQLKSYHF